MKKFEKLLEAMIEDMRMSKRGLSHQVRSYLLALLLYPTPNPYPIALAGSLMERGFRDLLGKFSALFKD
jgi:hypothetical protein